MRSLTATIVLLCLGVAANQLPLMWVGYSTWDLAYAKQHCINPNTSCNGSCQLKKVFAEIKSQAEDDRHIPISVLINVQELGTMFIDYCTTVFDPLVPLYAITARLDLPYTATAIEPPFTPPK